jgi:hypothetical protein
MVRPKEGPRAEGEAGAGCTGRTAPNRVGLIREGDVWRSPNDSFVLPRKQIGRRIRVGSALQSAKPAVPLNSSLPLEGGDPAGRDDPAAFRQISA